MPAIVRLDRGLLTVPSSLSAYFLIGYERGSGASFYRKSNSMSTVITATELSLLSGPVQLKHQLPDKN